MTIMLTGASGVIGLAIVRSCASQGHNLILFGNKNAEGLALATDICKTHDVMCLTYLGDLADEAFVSSSIRDAVSKLGHIDVFIHGAGIARISLLTDITTADWNQMINSNLTSLYQCCRNVVPTMVHQHSGRILSLSSVWGIRGASCEVAYSATKGGINAFTKALAKELAPSGISVNALALGMIDTKMNNCLSEEDRAAICDEIPAGHIASPEEVADMVSLMLAAPTYLTGQIIGFDGGWQV